MKILHLCLASFYIDYYSYQENLLPKYHKLIGHDVSIVASLKTFSEKGEVDYLPRSRSYINEHGISVHRIEYKSGFINRKIGRFKGIKKYLNEKIDLVFVHGIQFFDFKIVADSQTKYNYKIIVDNHADYTNSAKNIFSKYFLHKYLWKNHIKRYDTNICHYFGVLPARVSFLIDLYDAPPEKTSYLRLGIDDKEIEENASKDVFSIKKDFNLHNNKKIIVTGGKIDDAKIEVLGLMNLLKEYTDIELVVFGPVIPKLQKSFNYILSNSKNIKYINWLEPKESLKLFSIADLVIFPGRHSVFWEQVQGLGVPMLIQKNSNTDHFDAIPSVVTYESNEIEEKLTEIISGNKIKKLRTLAQNLKKSYYYSNIVLETIEVLNKCN